MRLKAVSNALLMFIAVVVMVCDRKVTKKNLKVVNLI